MATEPLLTVNVDHVATVRQARQTVEPDPVHAAVLAELGGADGITVHLREDRRHIQDRDVAVLRKTVKVPLNLELGLADEIVAIALDLIPDWVTVVPEKRQELTTEGGLDVAGDLERVAGAVRAFRKKKIAVSLFVDPDETQLRAVRETGAHAVELHTGEYAEACGAEREAALTRIEEAASFAAESLGLAVHAGHGLTYLNTPAVAAIEEVGELAIGHSIVARAVMVGMERAVADMKALIRRSRREQAM